MFTLRQWNRLDFPTIARKIESRKNARLKNLAGNSEAKESHFALIELENWNSQQIQRAQRQLATSPVDSRFMVCSAVVHVCEVACGGLYNICVCVWTQLMLCVRCNLLFLLFCSLFRLTCWFFRSICCLHLLENREQHEKQLKWTLDRVAYYRTYTAISIRMRTTDKYSDRMRRKKKQQLKKMNKKTTRIVFNFEWKPQLFEFVALFLSINANEQNANPLIFCYSFRFT